MNEHIKDPGCKDTPASTSGGGPDRRHLIGGAVVLSLGIAGGNIIARRAGSEDVYTPASGDEHAKLYEVDPALVRYEVARQITLNIPEAHAMAVLPDGRIVLAGAKTVIIDRDGAIAATLDVPGRSRAVTCAADGSIWTATPTQVAQHDTTGKRLADWSIPNDKGIITAIAVTPQHVYLADAHHRLVMQCDRAGKLIRHVARPDAGYIVPSPYFDLNVDADDRLHVVNPGRHQIECFDVDGRFLRAWGQTGNAIESFCGCCNPVSFALLPDGRFITAEKGIARVKRYHADGHFDAVVAPPSLLAGELTGGRTLSSPGKATVVATSPTGDVYILDPAAARIYFMTEKATA